MKSTEQANIVAKTAEFVRATLGYEPTGHDWWHADRVRKTAVYIASCDLADVFTVELAALLHDIKDYKFSGSLEAGPQTAEWWLRSLGVDPSVAVNVADIIRHMSYLGAKVEEWPLSLEGQCVQDGDCLDAIGAIGIARTFAYGGYVRRPIHDPHVPHVLHKSADEYRANQGTTINHFHEKLFLVRSRMRTETGRKLAARRHDYMVSFLEEFQSEWDEIPTSRPGSQ